VEATWIRDVEEYPMLKVPMLSLAAAMALLCAAAASAQDASPFGPPANVFIAPTGKVFRAKEGQPYPVVEWFKQADANHDGKIDKAEFLADAAAFFKVIDRNEDGVITPIEVAFYEQRIAPEILGYRVEVGSDGTLRPLPPALLWKVQSAGGIDRPSSVDPAGENNPDAAPHGPQKLDESGAGASPFSFFDEPEPVMAADLSFRGVVFKADYLKLAAIHFQTLDHKDLGYLTLADLPETPMQKRLAKGHRRR
jgi:hypothetical protein